jgi:hypothetical protein
VDDWTGPRGWPCRGSWSSGGSAFGGTSALPGETGLDVWRWGERTEGLLKVSMAESGMRADII